MPQVDLRLRVVVIALRQDQEWLMRKARNTPPLHIPACVKQ